MDFLKRKVNTIFIMLGNGCNMNCVYCLQHPLVHRPLCGEINPEIFRFLQTVRDENGARIRLMFYGGEPLLYFKTIKEITERLRADDFQFCLITNGRALTDEMVEFFNAHDFAVTVSWDGPHVLETRGFDAFHPRRPLRRRILRLERVGLSGVLSARAYPLETLDAMQGIVSEYELLHGRPCGVHLDEIFDTGLPDKSLLAVDYERVEREMDALAREYIDARLSGNERDTARLMYIGGLVERMNRFYLAEGGNYEGVRCGCGNGYTVLNLDLAGNLYTCHNVSAPIAAMTDDYQVYIRRIIAGDPTRKRRDTCAGCPAAAWCRGGCKLVSEAVRAETYCRMKRAVYAPVLRVFSEYAERMKENGL